jgi:DNA-binding IclR family transcriptional regulator
MAERRHGADRTYPGTTSLGPREAEALGLIQAQPGITVAELHDALGVGRARVWQIVNRLQAGRVWSRARDEAPA